MRRYSLFDQLLITADRAVKTLVTRPPAPAPRQDAAVRDQPLTEQEKSVSARLMRVNHAGEVSAQALYHGQALTSRSPATRSLLLQAADEEYQHLSWCEGRLRELGAHRSRLTPVWYTGSLTIGLAAGLAGDAWSLGFVSETENQVIRHLQGHLERLPPLDERSRAILEQMRYEEAHHGETARRAGGRPLPLSVQLLMRATSRVMTTGAYYL